MNVTGIPLFNLLKDKLGYLSERQKVIAQNVANADTPGFVSTDLTPFSFAARAKAHSTSQYVTHPRHMAPPRAVEGLRSGFKQVPTPGTETTMDGNSVVLEEEMIKMTDSRIGYEAAISFYQKSMNLIRMAARPPGR